MPKRSGIKKRAINTFPHLRKPPITEAVIEVRGPIGVEWNEGIVINGMQEFGDEYPNRLSMHGFQGQLQVALGAESKVETKDLGPRGLRFQSKDGLNVALLTADLFSFSRLNSYQTWDAFISEALKLWKVYKRIVLQNDATRLGVRFINRIPISEKRIQIEMYFKNFPNAVSGQDLDRIAFLHQDMVSIPEGNLRANIIKTVQPGAPADQRPALILDIDLFDEGKFAAQEDTLKGKLERFHYWKNWIFFNTVTRSLVEKLT